MTIDTPAPAGPFPDGSSAGLSLGEIAVRFGCELRGDPALRVLRVAGLQDATSDAVTFLANAKLQRFLGTTGAGAVILDTKFADRCRVPVLIAKNPHATFARVATLLHPARVGAAGVHATAVVHPSARIDASVSIGAHCVIGAQVVIDARVSLGPGCVVLDGVSIGEDSRLVARVTVCERARIGARCIVHPGAVIGSDGFGLAPDAGAWVKVPQVGSVFIGDDVEIGSNTTIDRGAIGDTVVETGVKLDNLIQIGHNVRIGAHTAIAAQTGIAGSTTIGNHCIIAGKVGITGHIDICDGVIITGKSTVTGSINQPGTYSSSIDVDVVAKFRRNVARFRHLDDMAKQLRRVSRALQLDDDSTSQPASQEDSSE